HDERNSRQDASRYGRQAGSTQAPQLHRRPSPGCAPDGRGGQVLRRRTQANLRRAAGDRKARGDHPRKPPEGVRRRRHKRRPRARSAGGAGGALRPGRSLETFVCGGWFFETRRPSLTAYNQKRMTMTTAAPEQKKTETLI